MKIKSLLSIALSLMIGALSQGQIVDLAGKGVYNSPLSTLTFTDPGSIDHVVVEAIYKKHKIDTQDPVRFFDGDETYTAYPVPVEFQLTDKPDNYISYPYYFTATFNTIDPGGITLDQLTNLGKIHSFIAYIYRSASYYDRVSYTDMNHVFMYQNGEDGAYDYVIPINTSDAARDITVKIPLSEMADDDRMCVINVSAGDQKIQQIIRRPNLGNSLNIIPLILTDVAADVKEVSVSIYSPPYNGTYALRGDSFISGGIVVDVDQNGDCGPCDGQMTSLSLEYLGSLQNATIRVYEGKVHPNKIIQTFKGVYTGDVITFTGKKNHNKLGSKVRITINHHPRYTEIHTSCSQPIDIGMIYDGLFLLVGGTSHNGGALCDDVTPPNGGEDCGPCEGQMTALTLEYQGNKTNATIRVYEGKIQASKLIDTFHGMNAGDQFTFYGKKNHGKLGAKVKLTINKNNQQYTEIHTSCSQPIEVGMLFDQIYLLVAGSSHGNGPLCDNSTKNHSGWSPDQLPVSRLIAYPNPITAGTTIEFESGISGPVCIELINMRGQVIKKIYQGETKIGYQYSLLVDVSDLINGLYLIRMTNAKEIINQKISIRK